jgi:FMN phosphatase YigB (HAD superfamily)
MISTIICGLSEVLIPGLKGTNQPPAGASRAAGDVILERLVAEDLRGLCIGEMTEEEFCRRLLDRAGWPTDIEHLRAAIRERFRGEVPGTADVLRGLTGRYRLVLMTDHAREWIEGIRLYHREILEIFDRAFFSYDLKQTKADPGTFRMVLGLLDDEPAECLLIDDEQVNLAAAAAAGIEGILFKNANQLANALADRGITPQAA